MQVLLAASTACCIDLGAVRNNCPVYAFFFIFPLVSLSNPHSFIMTSYVPYCVLVRAVFSLLDEFLSFLLFPDHMINHLITMCLPHGFVVTGHWHRLPTTTVCLHLFVPRQNAPSLSSQGKQFIEYLE